MNHWPFIIGAYAAATIVLGWTAIAPWLRQRQLQKLVQGRSRQNPGAGS